MAKVAKAKKREPTVHSRAHRRNASPPPKDLAVKSVAADEEIEYKPWLHNAQNAGIGKKKKVKQLSRQQKERQQKAIERADANLDKLATKVKDSKARGRKVQARRAEWEELNGSAGQVVNGEKEEGEGKDGDVDGGAEGVELDVGMSEVAPTAEKQAEKDDGTAVALPDPEDDEEL